MIVTCQQCATQFYLEDAKVPEAGIRVRCSRCKFAFMVESPQQSEIAHGESVARESLPAAGARSNTLRDLFEGDDYYTDADSNAHALVKFVGNHDVGRLGFKINLYNPGAADAERMARIMASSSLSSPIKRLSRNESLKRRGVWGV